MAYERKLKVLTELILTDVKSDLNSKFPSHLLNLLIGLTLVANRVQYKYVLTVNVSYSLLKLVKSV